MKEAISAYDPAKMQKAVEQSAEKFNAPAGAFNKAATTMSSAASAMHQAASRFENMMVTIGMGGWHAPMQLPATEMGEPQTKENAGGG
jgi:hypothetical protein